MKLKVICKKCDRIFNWDMEKENMPCPYCHTDLTIKDVRMNPLELKKYQRYKSQHRTQTNVEETQAGQGSASFGRTSQRLRVASQETEEKKQLDDNIKGRFQIKKGRTKYGTLEITNPDYMIFKMSFWAMGPQQKYLVKELNTKIRQFLKETGFNIEKRW